MIGVLKNFTNFTGKHLYQSLFFNKVAGQRSATLLKKKLWHKCFPVTFVKFLRAPFLQNTSGRLFLKVNLEGGRACNLQKQLLGDMFFKIGVIKNFAIFIGKHLR